MIKHMEITAKGLFDAGKDHQHYIRQCMAERGPTVIRYVDNDGNIEYSTDVEVMITWLSNGNLRFSWEAEEYSLDSLA